MMSELFPWFIAIIFVCIYVFLFRKGWKLEKDREIGGLKAGIMAVSYNRWFNPHPFRFIEESPLIDFGDESLLEHHSKEAQLQILADRLDTGPAECFVNTNTVRIYNDLITNILQNVTYNKSEEINLSLIIHALVEIENSPQFIPDYRQEIGIDIGLLLTDLEIDNSKGVITKWI